MTVKRAIGIDVSTHYVRAVQMVRDAETLYIEKIFHAPTRRSTDSQRQLIDTLIDNEQFDLQSPVAVALPHAGVFFRDLRLTEDQNKRLQQGDVSILEHHIPIAAQEIVTEICARQRLDNDQIFVLSVTTSHQIRQDRLNLFADKGLYPELLDTEFSAVLASLSVNYPESQSDACVVAYLDDTHLGLAIVKNGLLLLVRNTPLQWDAKASSPDQELRIAGSLAQEVSITWQKAFAQGLNQQTALYLCTGCELSEGLHQRIEQYCPCTLVFADPFTHIGIAPGQARPVDITLAQGLAIRLLHPQETAGVNFLAKKQNHGGGPVDLRKQSVLLGGLVAAIAMMWLIGLFVQLAVLESRYKTTKQEINQAFKAILPNEKSVNPVAQMQQKIEQVQKEKKQLQRLTGLGQGPLWIMQQLSSTKPTQGDIVLKDLLISTDTIQLTGTCADFDPLYTWQKQLEAIKSLGILRIDPRREKSDAPVQFTLSIDMTAEAS